MQDLYTKIEHLIFLQNYTSPLLTRDSALMCIHSALLGFEHVPRFYLPKSVPESGRQEWVWGAISYCLLSEPKDIENLTITALKLLHCPINDIRKLSPQEKHDCQKLIEDSMTQLLGDGEIYYESSRFSPFSNQDISELLRYIDSPRSSEQALIYKRLRERTLSKLQYQQKHDYIIQKMNLSGKWDMFHAVYKFKLEQLWQQTWLSANRYQENPSIINIILPGEVNE